MLSCAVQYITAKKRAMTTQDETVVGVHGRVYVLLCYLGLSSVRVYLICSHVAVTFQGSCNLAEHTKRRQAVEYLGCQLDRGWGVEWGWGGQCNFSLKE